MRTRASPARRARRSASSRRPSRSAPAPSTGNVAGTSGTVHAPPSAASQVGLEIVQAATNRIEHLRVHLEPPDLGQVDLELSFRDDGRVSAVVAAERADTLEVLQRDAQALERGLQDAGLKTETGGLSFALRRGPQNGRTGADGNAQHDAGPGAGTTAGTTEDPARPAARLRLLDIHA